MSARLNFLLLEDPSIDLASVREYLVRRFPDCTVAQASGREEYLDRLGSERFDAILSPAGVTGCEGLQAFYLSRDRQPQTAFVYLPNTEESGLDLRGLQALGIAAVLPVARLTEVATVVARVLESRTAAAPEAPELHRYERLVTVVKQLSLARDLPAIMAVVRRAARELTGADGATFVLRDNDECYYADEDAIGPLWKGQRFPLQSCISGWAMTHRQPAVVEDIFTDPRIPLSAYEPTFARSVVMMPIRAAEPIGAIGAYWSTARLPDPREVRLLQALADTTAVAMENVRIMGDLEAKVRERTADLESFTYAISHDLRVPIRHLQAYAAMLLEDYGPTLEPRLQKGLLRLDGAAARMGEMVEGLLELSRMARAPVRRRPVDLAKLAAEVAEECRVTTGREVTFVAPPSAPATGDPTLLRIVLQNLLGNAWKFSGKVAAPRVEFGTTRGDDGSLTFFVADNGAGFNPEVAGKLFGVFQRLHTQEDFPGTGVGLASVQRIIRKHQGRVWAQGKPGEGATFFFTLGRDDAPSP